MMSHLKVLLITFMCVLIHFSSAVNLAEIEEKCDPKCDWLRRGICYPTCKRPKCVSTITENIGSQLECSYKMQKSQKFDVDKVTPVCPQPEDTFECEKLECDWKCPNYVCPSRACELKCENKQCIPKEYDCCPCVEGAKILEESTIAHFGNNIRRRDLSCCDCTNFIPYQFEVRYFDD